MKLKAAGPEHASNYYHQRGESQPAPKVSYLLVGNCSTSNEVQRADRLQHTFSIWWIGCGVRKPCHKPARKLQPASDQPCATYHEIHRKRYHWRDRVDAERDGSRCAALKLKHVLTT